MTTIDQLQALLNKPVKSIGGCSYKDVLPAIKCVDGTTLSVQASEMHYSTPRENTGPYTNVEVWCIRATTDIAPHFDYDESDPSGYVPIEAVVQFIDAHGGLVQE